MATNAWLPWPTFGGKQLWGDVFLRGGYRIQRHAMWKHHHRLLDPWDRRLVAGSWEACRAAFEGACEGRDLQPVSDHLVLLLHGIFRSKDSFGPMTKALRKAGYEAHAVNYPSTRQSLEAHAEQLEALLDHAEGIRRVSFVTHSMGGIVTRVLLSRPGAWRERIEVHRVVLIGTPNRGAEIASLLGQVGPFRAVAGPALEQLHPDRHGDLPPLTAPFAIIAGGRGDERGFNPLLPGDNDMTVTVEETRLDGADDFLLVPAVHTFIMVHPSTIEATIHYLGTGRLTAG